MLKLICTVKCGYEKLYICEKDVEIPLDFLTNKEIYEKLFPDTALNAITTPEELYATYVAKPNEFVKDFGLFKFIYTMISTEYKSSFFKNINDPLHPNFPEFFKIEDCRLIYEKDLFNLNSLWSKISKDKSDIIKTEDTEDDQIDDSDIDSDHKCEA